MIYVIGIVVVLISAANGYSSAELIMLLIVSANGYWDKRARIMAERKVKWHANRPTL